MANLGLRDRRDSATAELLLRDRLLHTSTQRLMASPYGLGRKPLRFPDRLTTYSLGERTGKLCRSAYAARVMRAEYVEGVGHVKWHSAERSKPKRNVQPRAKVARPEPFRLVTPGVAVVDRAAVERAIAGFIGNVE